MISSKMPVSFQMVVTAKVLDRQNQRNRHLNKAGTMIENEKIEQIATLQKEVEGIPEIHLLRRKLKKK